MSSFDIKPPYCNTGVVNTCECASNLLIDWVQATIFNDTFHHDIYTLFFILFGIKKTDVIFNIGGHYGYSYTYSYKDIEVYVSDDDRMGIHIQLSGSGCRDFELLNIGYEKLFNTIIKYNGHFTRIDLAVDVFHNRFFTINKLRKKIKSGEVVSKYLTTTTINKTVIKTSESMGDTIYFGVKSSSIFMRVYDKLLERHQANYLVNDNIEHWYRWETQLKSERADKFVFEYLDNSDLGRLVYGIISNYINVVYKTSDSNRSRWPSCKWWTLFLNDVDKLKLTPVATETSISKKQQWLDRQASKSITECFISNIQFNDCDTELSQYIFDILKTGFYKFKDKDLIYINEYRVKNGYAPLEMDDIKYYIQNIKDVLILKKEGVIDNSITSHNI